MTVFGVDASTTRTGLARPDGTTVSFTARAGSDDPIRRLHELAGHVARELQRWPDAELLVIEAVLLFGPGRQALVRLGELSGAIRLLAFERDLAVVEIPGTALKLAAAGNGRASKEQMVDAAVAAGGQPRNHDEADAWHLHNLGRRALAGLELPATVAALPWPTPTGKDRRS